jgi:hypothetical protein
MLVRVWLLFIQGDWQGEVEYVPEPVLVFSDGSPERDAV